MNKKTKSILGSVLVVAVAVMLTHNGTESFLSDSEISRENILTIGEIDLKIDWKETWSAYDGILEEQMETDLTENQAIFELDDVKPGDDGEATISLHVIGNDAWACIDIVPVSNDDESSNEPELEVDDPEDEADLWDGELAQNLDLKIWIDEGLIPGIQGRDEDSTEGDNIWQDYETPLYIGTALPEMGTALAMPGMDAVATPLPGGLPLWNVPIDGNRDEEGIQPLIGCKTYYIGFHWEIPWEVGNEIQSDSFVFNMNFLVSQYRNQPVSPCTPNFQQYPEIGGNVYLGYEDWKNGDLDYNDFGMQFNTTETYNQNMELLEILMQFEAIIYDSGADHYIHIKKPLNGNYMYTVTRSTPANANEHPAGVFMGSGDFDIVLFDTGKYLWPSKQIGETVTVTIVPLDPAANPLVIPLTPPRDYDTGSGLFYDLDAFMGRYDPYIHVYTPNYIGTYHIGTTQFIGDTGSQGDTPDIIPVGTEVPYILVVPYTDWIPPDEDTTITGPYQYFDDFYTNNGVNPNWYLPGQLRTSPYCGNSVNDGGLSWGPYPVPPGPCPP